MVRYTGHLLTLAGCAALTGWAWAWGAPGFAQDTVVLTATLVPTCVLRDDACVLLAPAPGVTCERVGDGCALVVEPEPPASEEPEATDDGGT